MAASRRRFWFSPGAMGGIASPASGLAALLLSFAAPLEAESDHPEASGQWTSSTVLTSMGGAADSAPLGRCSASLGVGSSALELHCRHALGVEGEVWLVRSDRMSTSAPLLRVGPLGDPLEAEILVPDEVRAALFAGDLALRIEGRSRGDVVAEGIFGGPIFDSGFDVFGLCEWSNFPCPSDGNVCTDEVCSPTGACSHPHNSAACTLPNATAACAAGSCGIVACDNGHSNCDASTENGCEVHHDSGGGTCDNATLVGEYPGDLFCGAFCPANTSEHLFATRTGRQEAWFQARALESSSCTANVRHYVDLDVPAGVDYDLFVYRGCSLVASSTSGGLGGDESITIEEPETIGSDDTFVYQIEVRWFTGKSCSSWTLNLTGLTC